MEPFDLFSGQLFNLGLSTKVTPIKLTVEFLS